MATTDQPHSTIREKRQALRVSRERLGASAGLSGGTVRRIEIGEVQPHRSSLILLAQALGCAVEDIDPHNDKGPAAHGSPVTTAAERARDHVLEA